VGSNYADALQLSIADYSVHPPFYYFVLHFWMGLGEDLYTIRLLSVLISTACIPCIYLLGREILSSPGALVAATLMAIAPFQIFHGQQARMYPLLTLLVLATACFFYGHGGKAPGYIGLDWACVSSVACTPISISRFRCLV